MSDATLSSMKRHHAVIAGTGRAGTTFLVQFLAACGVDTGDVAWLDERANAGLEIPLNSPDAPYLTKDPWLYLYCDQLDLEEMAIDVVILPIRDLRDAAASRLIQEKSRVIENLPDHFARADGYGTVAGGSIYSLEPLDLERILATGFYRVLQWAVRNDIPVVLLDFPRLVNNSSHLIDNLWPWLKTFCSREEAERAFSETAKSEKVSAGTSYEQPLSSADFRAMQVVVRELQREAQSAHDIHQELRREVAKIRQEKAAIEGSRLWRVGRMVLRLIGR